MMSPGTFASSPKWSREWIDMAVTLVPAYYRQFAYWRINSSTYFGMTGTTVVTREDFTGPPTLKGFPVDYDNRLEDGAVILAIRYEPSKPVRLAWETLRKATLHTYKVSWRICYYAERRRDGLPTS
jgi:hypothetical protein